MGDTTTTYEIRVRYNNRGGARFVEPDWEQALALAESLGKLPATRKVFINKLTIEPVYAWEK